MLTVKGHRLLIKPDPVKEQVKLPEALAKSNFEIHRPVELEKREEAGTEIGTVVQVGKTAFRAFDGKDEQWEPWAKVGDRVLFTRYSGKKVEDPVTKEKFFVINDEDVQAVITGEYNPFEGVL